MTAPDPGPHEGTILIYSIHNSEAWWRCVGENMGFERAVLVSDLRGEGDYNVVDDFYEGFERHYAAATAQSPLLDAGELDDVIARCRVLRWLPRRRAAAMAIAMTEAMERVLDATAPRFVVSWPIDRYVSDVLERRVKARGIPYIELTASALPDMAMMLYRGQLVTRPMTHDAAEIGRRVRQIADPLYAPAYVQGKSRFTFARWLRVFGYFKLRGWAFRAISLAKRDPQQWHYLDAQGFLGHKPRLADRAVLGMFDADWQTKLDAFPKDKRLFMALQLFPEASIDYWIDDLKLVDHEDMLVEAAAAFSRAGYAIAIKDHPLQFGFRQRALLERLRAIPNTIFVPYDVSGNAMLALTGVSFTSTGTLGLQAALLGMKSVTYKTYYTTPGDFILFERRDEIAGLPARVEAEPAVDDLPARQQRIVAKLLEGSFSGDFMSFRGFDAGRSGAKVGALGRALGDSLTAIEESGHDLGDGSQWTARR